MAIQSFKRKKGIMYRYRFTLRGITVSSEMYEDKLACQRDEAKARADILGGTYVPNEKRTVAQLWKMYCEFNPVKAGTQKNRNNAFNKMVGFGLADMQANKVTALHLDKFMKHLQELGYSDQTISNYSATANAIFKWAYAKRLIPMNPATFTDKFKKSKKTKPIEIFSLEEFTYRLSVIKEKHPHLYAPAILAGFFGLRNGEICAVNIFEDFDFKNNILTVSKQYGYLGTSKQHFDEPKTEDGIREVPIISYALPFIQENIEYVQQQARDGIVNLYPGDTNLPFCVTKEGKRYQPNHLAKCWHEMNIKEGWKHLTLHKLRHTYATLCRDAEVPMETISDLLGHADTKTTKRIYAHKTFVQLNNAAKSLDNLFKNNV